MKKKIPMLQQLLPTNNLTSDPQNDFTECWKLLKTKNEKLQMSFSPTQNANMKIRLT